MVEHAEKLSGFFGISRLTIGFLLVSVLTSLPELAIAVSASLVGSSGIVFGNVFSANIFNMLFVIGISAVIYGAIKISKEEMNEVAMVVTATTAIVLYIILNSFFGPGLLGYAEGIILLGFFCLYAFFSSKKKNIDGMR